MITTAELYLHFLQHPQICTDTRKLTPGCMFFALKGGNFNGNLFAAQALEQGAAFAVIDEVQPTMDARMLLVEDVLTALQQLATHHRRALNIPVLAITGSNGKTTTKELIAAVLQRKFNTCFTQGNLNNHIGVPLTLLSLTKDHQFAVVEMGANHQKEIELLCSIAEPDFGLITNVGKAHLEGFGGFEGVKKGKGEMYAFLKANHRLVFLHNDNEHLRGMLGDYTSVITYGNTGDYSGNAIEGQEFLHVAVQHPFSTKIETQITGSYNFANVMAAVAIGAHFGVPQGEIVAAIAAYNPDNQRSQIIRKGELSIVLDAYNANPTSMRAALENFTKSFTGEKYIALGEMLELGEESAAEHAGIFEATSSCNASFLLLVGKNFQPFEGQANVHYFATSADAATWLSANKPLHGTLLIKGSRGSKMEKLMEAFQ